MKWWTTLNEEDWWPNAEAITAVVAFICIAVFAGLMFSQMDFETEESNRIKEIHQMMIDHSLDHQDDRRELVKLGHQIDDLRNSAISVAMEYEQLQQAIHKEWTGIVNSRAR